MHSSTGPKKQNTEGLREKKHRNRKRFEQKGKQKNAFVNGWSLEKTTKMRKLRKDTESGLGEKMPVVSGVAAPFSTGRVGGK